MTPKSIENRIIHLKEDIERELLDRLPRKVGIIAVNHFKQNFRDAGFRNNGVRPWKTTKRQEEGGKDANYTPLTSRRDHLMRSIQYESGPGEVTITNPVEYADIHNEGGVIHSNPRITPKLRKFAWAKVYSIAGIKKRKGKKTPLPKLLPEKARMWKAIALTKKNRLNIVANIPKRQFIGDSAELNRKIEKTINESLINVQNKVLNGTRNL